LLNGPGRQRAVLRDGHYKLEELRASSESEITPKGPQVALPEATYRVVADHSKEDEVAGRQAVADVEEVFREGSDDSGRDLHRSADFRVTLPGQNAGLEFPLDRAVAVMKLIGGQQVR